MRIALLRFRLGLCSLSVFLIEMQVAPLFRLRSCTGGLFLGFLAFPFLAFETIIRFSGQNALQLDDIKWENRKKGGSRPPCIS